MIVVYTSPGCASCRKVKSFLKDNDLEYIEKNIFTTLLNKNEIKYLLSRTENGTDDIISKRSKIIQESNVDIESMSINELCDFIVQNPSILKRPIIIDNKNMQIGYDEEEIELFNKLKSIARCECRCPHYENCGEIRKEAD
ncbi:MAG: transcriptional regulator Spx [Erysipelotrichaceae bacterium]|nr:transcriptional regulator Spx [Erysipelotrichaceae bacterium]